MIPGRSGYCKINGIKGIHVIRFPSAAERRRPHKTCDGVGGNTEEIGDIGVNEL